MRYKIAVIVCFWFVCATNCARADSGTVTGRLLLSDGKPLSGGQVFFFEVKSPLDKPVLGKYWRVPDAIERVDSGGRFKIELDTGSYYIAAIKRFSVTKLGPPQIGDFFLPSHDSKGTYRVITVKTNKTTNVGTIKGIRRVSAQHAVFTGMPTAIKGRVTSASGQPAQNMYVLAYTDPSMQGRPSFVSAESDSEGRYYLPVDKGRIYYLKVRDIYAGGRPQAGNLVGVFGTPDEPTPVDVKTSSTTEGIDIQVDAFAGRGK
jgi:hypothetical protein